MYSLTGHILNTLFVNHNENIKLGKYKTTVRWKLITSTRLWKRAETMEFSALRGSDMKQRRGGKSWALCLSQAHAHVVSSLCSPEKRSTSSRQEMLKQGQGARLSCSD